MSSRAVSGRNVEERESDGRTGRRRRGIFILGDLQEGSGPSDAGADSTRLIGECIYNAKQKVE